MSDPNSPEGYLAAIASGSGTLAEANKLIQQMIEDARQSGIDDLSINDVVSTYQSALDQSISAGNSAEASVQFAFEFASQLFDITSETTSPETQLLAALSSSAKPEELEELHKQIISDSNLDEQFDADTLFQAVSGFVDEGLTLQESIRSSLRVAELETALNDAAREAAEKDPSADLLASLASGADLEEVLQELGGDDSGNGFEQALENSLSTGETFTQAIQQAEDNTETLKEVDEIAQQAAASNTLAALASGAGVKELLPAQSEGTGALEAALGAALQDGGSLEAAQETVQTLEAAEVEAVQSAEQAGGLLAALANGEDVEAILGDAQADAGAQDQALAEIASTLASGGSLEVAVAAAETKAEALEDAIEQEAQSPEAKLALALASGDAVEEVVSEVLGEDAAGSNAEANVANALSSGESVQEVVAEAEEAATAEQEANAQAEAVADPVVALASGEAPAAEPEQPSDQADSAEAPAPASEGPGSAPEEAPQDAAEEATTEEPEAAATSESTEVPAEASEPASQDAPQDSEADVSSETVAQTEDTASEETNPLDEATEEDAVAEEAAEAEEAEPESSDVDPETSEEPSEEVEDTASTEEDSATQADEVTSDEEAVEEGTSDEPAEDTAETEPSDPAEQDDAASNSDENPDPDTEADVPNSDDAPLQSDDPVDEAPQEQVTEEEPLIAEAQTEPDVPQAESAETPASEAASAPEETPSVAAVTASEQNGPFGGGNPFATPALGTTPPAFGANPFGPSSSVASTSTPPQSEAPPTRPVFTPTTPSDGDDQDSAAIEDTAPPANVLPEITVAHILRYTENEAATATAPAISIVDNDTANLEAARVWISDGFEAAEDVLAFTSQAGISGSYDPSTGVLTFSGQAEVSAYQALLQSISYQNTSDHPATLSKTISYQVDDAIGGETLSNVGQTSIEITRANDAPVLVDFQKTGAEDTDVAFTSTDFTSVFSDADGDALAQIEIRTLPQNATLFLNSTVVVSGQVIPQADLNSLVLRPDTNFTGTITFDFKASDGTVDSASDATATVVVSAQNDAPTISVSAAAALTEDADASSQSINANGVIQFGDVDTGDSISISSRSNGDITWSGGTLASGLSAALVAGFSASVSGASAPGSINWTYAATGLDLDFLGSSETITFSYTVTATDFAGASASEQLTLTITGQNDAPVVAARTGSVDENGSAITVTASFTDADSSDSHSYTIDTTSTTGSVVNNGDGTFSYDPNGQFEHLAAGETATDSFTYTVNDSNGGAFTATVTLTITGENDAPVVAVSSASVDEDSSVNIDVLSGASDAESQRISVASITQPTNGSAVLEANGTVTFTPNANFNGTDSFTYTASDGNGGQVTETVSITVAAQNDAPVVTVPAAGTSASLTGTADQVSGTFGNTNDGAAFAITALENGGFATVSPGGSPSQLVVSDANGNEVFSGTPHDTYRTYGIPGEISDLGNDTFIVTWVEARHTIYGRVFNYDGTAVTGDIQLSDTGSFVDGGQTVSALTSGGFVMTYKSWDGSKYDIRIREFDANGVAQGASFDTGADNRWADQSSATFGTDGLAIVYTNDDDANNLYQNGLILVRTNGTVISNIVLDAEPSGGQNINSQGRNGIATLKDGSVVAVVAQQDADGAMNIYAHHFAADGTRIGSTIHVADWSGSDFDGQRKPEVVALEDGGFSVVFANERSTQTDASGTSYVAGTYVQQFDAQGVKIGDPLFINSGTHPQISLGSDGKLLVAGYGVNGYAGISIQKVTPAVAGLSVNEDQSLSIAGISVSDVDAAESGDQVQLTLTVQNGTLATTGTATISGDGTATLVLTGTAAEVNATLANLSYTPTLNFNGTDTLNAQISDQGNSGAGGVQTATGSTTITVNAVNDVAQISGDSTGAVTENTGTAATGTLSVVDVDTGEASFVAGSITGTYGALTLASGGGWSYALDDANTTVQALDDGQTLQDVVTVQSADGTQQNITITIVGQNDAPVAVADGYSVDEDNVLTVQAASGLRANDSDVDANDSLTALLVSDVSNGSLTLNADGSFTYTPNGNFAGTDSFSYKQNDGTTDGNTVSVTLTVNAVNDAPVAVADTAFGAFLYENAFDSGMGVVSETGGNPTFIATSGFGYQSSNNEALLLDNDSASVSGIFSVDLGTLTAPGTYTVTIDVGNFNNRPFVEITSIGLRAGGVFLVATSSTTPEPALGQEETWTFSYDITQAHIDTGLSFAVDVPTSGAAQNGSLDNLVVSKPGTTVISGSVAANDSDPDAGAILTYTLDTPVDGLTLNTDGSYSFDTSHATYQALADGQTQNVVANYTVTDEHGATAQTSLTITVTGEDDAPTITLKSSADFSASLATSANEQARHLLIDSDGKILVGATIDENAGVLRINSDGTIDTSFGTSGVATFDIGQYDIVHGILQQSDGKYIVQSATVSGHWGAGLVRFNTDGSVDTAFGGTGTGSIFVNTLSKDAPADGLTALADGRLIVVGYSNEADGNQTYVLRFSADGVLDTSFGTNGTKSFNPVSGSEAPYAVTTLADGNIMIAGIANENFFLAKLDADGNPVNAFGTNGYVSTDIQGYDEANSLVETSDGKIIVSGYTNGGADIALARYNADGSLDSSFGTNGIVITDIGGTSDIARSLAVQSDGKILVIGNTGAATQDIFTAQYNSDGTLDTSFGTNGILIRDVSSSEIGFDVAVDGNGKFLSLLNANFGANTDLLVERRNPDGSLDDGSTTYVKGQNPVVIDALIDVSDPELSGASDFGGARFTLSRNGGANTDDVFGASGNLGGLSQGGQLVLSNSNIGTVTTNSAGSLDITFAAGVTEAQVEEVMRSVTYQNDAGSPPSSVSLDWTFYDGTSGTPLSATATSTLAIDANADAPSLAYGPQTLDLTGGAYMRVDDTSNLQVTAASGGNPQTYSIEMWVKPDSIGSFQVFFSGDQLGSDTNGTSNFGILADGKFEYEINNIGTIQTNNSVFTAGQWTHVAVTHNGDTSTKVYIDGTEAATNASTIADMTTFSDVLIGRRGIGSSFSGEVDEVRIWDVERSANDIGNNKDQQLSGNEAGILGLWSLNGNNSDSAGSADGTTSGSATYSSQTNLQVPSGQDLKALLLGEDIEGSSLTLSVDSSAANGTAQVDGAVVTYTNSGGVNDDSFALSISDQTNSSIQSITVDVI